MTRPSRVVLLTLAVALTAGAASAAEKAQSCPAPPHKIVMIDGELFHPSTSTMSEDDVLQFENYSANTMRLVFTEPKDQTDKIRCQPVARDPGRPARAPSLLVAPGPNHQLTAIVPPGRFASVCSFAPGRYAFVASRVGMNAQSSADTLGTKGTITVRSETACAPRAGEGPGS